MSKTITANETIYRTATIYLKNADSGSDSQNVQDSVDMVETSVNKIASMHDKYSQVFTKNNESKKYSVDIEDFYSANMVCDVFVGDHNRTMDSSHVHGIEMRGFKVGDIVEINEWAYDEESMGIRGKRPRFFIIDEMDFSEFDIVKGEMI